jgi:PAS domain S-box-containing protein
LLWYKVPQPTVTSKKAGSSLPENEEHYRDLVENSLDLICTHDLNGVLLTANRAAARSLGYEPSEIINRNLRDFISPKVCAELDAYLVLIREKGAASGFMRLRTKSGETRIWKYVNSLRTTGVPVPLVRGIAHDVTDILRAQKALRESEERLRVATEVGRMYAWDWDPVTDSVRRSAECVSILGLDDAVRLGAAKDYFNFVHPGDRARVWALANSLTPKDPIYRTEYRRYRSDGVLLWLEESGHAAFDETGKIVRLVGMTADITDRKKAEVALRESEERFRIAAQAGRMYAYDWDVASDIVVRSPECVDLLGIGEPTRTTRRELMAKVHPDDRCECDMIGLTPQNPIAQVRYRVARSVGSFMWVEKTARGFFDEEGRLIRVVGMIADITERKQAEEKLRASEERFQLAAQAGKMFAYEWDATSDLITRSTGSSEILGIDETTPITAQQLLAKVHPDDRQRLTAAVSNLSPDNPSLEIRYRMVIEPDGAVIWVERNSRAHFDEHGRMLRIIGMVADVTERKRTEEALREAEERLRLAIQAGRMYAFEWDPVSDVIVRSGECRDIFNWMDDPAHDIGQQFVARVHADDREAYRALDTGLSASNPVYQTSYRVLRPDGKLIWLEESGHAFFDSQGKILRMIGMVADVTARKSAEEALASLSRRLIEAQEQERYRIARELHDDLGQRMALLQIGLEQFEQKIPELSSSHREQLRNIAHAASELSSDLHNLSHQLHPVKLDLQGLVAAMGGLCKELSKQHDLQVKFVHNNVPAEIPKAAALCLFRIVQEALRNVVKHGKTGEAKVELIGHAHEIDLRISDSGAGFNPQSAEAKGGLGLVSMRERLRLIGGRLTLESEPSQGTRIRVHVPLPSSARQVPNSRNEIERMHQLQTRSGPRNDN